MRLRLIFLFLFFGSVLHAQELIKTDWEQGYVKDGKKYSVWQYFNSKKEPELVINHTTGKVIFVSKDTSDYVILQDGQWVNSKLDIHPIPTQGYENFFITIKSEAIRLSMNFINCLEGRVVIFFEVDSLGNSANYFVRSPSSACDTAVIESLMEIDQKWIPARIGGKRYSSRFAVPIEFSFYQNESPTGQQLFSAKEVKMLPNIMITRESRIFNFVDQSAEFIGGMDALLRFLRKTLKYPSNASRYGIQGKVFVKFIIEVNGSISSVELQSGINKELDDEALRVVSLMPNWKPAKIKGIPVRQSYLVPVIFKLDDK